MAKKQRKRADKEIDFIPLLKALLSKVWLMVLVGAVTAGIAFTVTKLFVKPTYRCGFTAYVNNQRSISEDKAGLSNQDLIAAQQLTKTFSHIISSNTVLSAALESIDSDLSYGEVREMVSTDIMEGTELITVYVTTEDPKLSYDISKAIAKTAPIYMEDIVDGSSMKIVDYPQMNPGRHSPSYVKISLLGFLLGVLLVAAYVIIQFFTDDTVKDESEMEDRFRIPLLGVIPDVSSAGSDSYYRYNKYSSYSHYGYQQTDKEGRAAKHE